MDVCVVLYRSDPGRVVPGLRESDRLLVWDNSEDNIGFAAGANRAARMGMQSLVCFVNPDGDLVRDCLNRLETAMQDPSIVACSAFLDHMTPAFHPNGDAEWLPGTCLVVRRTAFEQVGGFDERLFMYNEDLDLSFRLRDLGRLVVVQEARFPHDWGHGMSFMSQHRLYRNYLVVDNRYRRANPFGTIRDAAWAIRRREWVTGGARLTGVLDFLMRGRRWR
jgi:GT2 family glycosyltransferase